MDTITLNAPDRTSVMLRRAKGAVDGPLARRHRLRFVGNGEEIVVFSHGLGTDQSVWNGVVETLPDAFTAMLFDLPGAGPLLPADFDPEDYASLAPFADDLLDLLDEAGVERCRYVGHSVSGMIGVLAAIEAPDRFEQLVLLSASPRYLNHEDYVGGFEREDLDSLFETMTANYQGWVAGFAPMAIGANVPEAVQEFAAGLLAMRPDVTATVARAIFESDIRHLLPLCQVPVSLLHSANDVAVPAAVAHYLHRHLHGSSLTWLDTDGHLPHLSAPQVVARALYEQLA
ncbi:alpha/beta fold hydrolase [Sphingosinicella sp. BN140058]|uniref:alpha/beta fold hydrolase n=1 Tax=Sphingosinicella sp. BN140058 TaxID=1892855 RepID=UPI001012A8D7|nr:alpha/beta hydrolase [Sphingosinicella sp. BN140058]QAY78006.1 alpha/beta fold hydrolase [Sphingosinicella sp. BN140058]